MEEANYWILRLLKMGFYERWRYELLPNATRCQGIRSVIKTHTHKSKPHQLTLQESYGVFIIILIGGVISLAVFLIEIFNPPQIYFSQVFRMSVLRPK